MTWYRNPATKPVSPETPLGMSFFELHARFTSQMHRIGHLLQVPESILPAYKRKKILDTIGMVLRAHKAAGQYLKIKQPYEAKSLMEHAYRNLSYVIFHLENILLKTQR